MRLYTRGVPGCPVMLLLHPELADYAFFDRLVDALAGRYRLAIPVFDGHLPDSPDFDNCEHQASKVLDHLATEGISRVRVVMGSGLGARVGLHLAAMAPRSVFGMVVFDGLHVGGGMLAEAMLRRRLSKMRVASLRSPDRGARLVDSSDEGYRLLVAQTAAGVSGATIGAVAHELCRADLPVLDPSVQARATFTWGGFDPNGSAHGRVAEAYPYARCVIKDRQGTYGYYLSDTEAFAREFLEI